MKEDKALYRAQSALLAAQRKASNEKIEKAINILFTRVQSLRSVIANEENKDQQLDEILRIM